MKQKLINTSQNIQRFLNTTQIVLGSLIAVIAGVSLMGSITLGTQQKFVAGAYLIAQAVVVLVAQVYKANK